MEDVKIVNTPLDHPTKLLVMQCLQIEEEKNMMKSNTYASGVENVMYDMIYSRPVSTYAVSIVSQFMTYHSQIHSKFIKWKLKYYNSSLKGDLKYLKSTQKEDTLENSVDIDYALNVDNK